MAKWQIRWQTDGKGMPTVNSQQLIPLASEVSDAANETKDGLSPLETKRPKSPKPRKPTVDTETKARRAEIRAALVAAYGYSEAVAKELSAPLNRAAALIDGKGGQPHQVAGAVSYWKQTRGLSAAGCEYIAGHWAEALEAETSVDHLEPTEHELTDEEREHLAWLEEVKRQYDIEHGYLDEDEELVRSASEVTQ